MSKEIEDRLFELNNLLETEQALSFPSQTYIDDLKLSIQRLEQSQLIVGKVLEGFISTGLINLD